MSARQQNLQPETLFSENSLWQSWLDVEAALARVQAELNIIPHWAAEKINSVATVEQLGSEKISKDITVTMAPILSLTRILSQAAGDAGHFVHWGATTQNVMQTGRILLIRQANTAICQYLSVAARRLADLAFNEAGTMMIGRTNRQHALPITFGFKVAGWIAEFDRCEARLTDATTRLFVLPFGGAVGAMHAYGSMGRPLNHRLARELALTEMLVPGRTMNDVFAEYIVQLSLLGMFIERVMGECYTLIGQDFGELGELLDKGTVGSSTMPQKINPKYVVPVMAKAAHLRGYAVQALETGRISHEGDPVSNQLLYSVLDQAVPLAWQVAKGFSIALERLVVNRDKMAQNLEAIGDAISTENLMMQLAPFVGRGNAHDIIHHALENGDVNKLKLNEEINKHLSSDVISAALDPANYLGDSVDIAQKAAQLANDLANRLAQK